MTEPMQDDPTTGLVGSPQDIAPAVIRTAVPILVSVITSWAARKGLEIDDATRQLLLNLASLLVGTGYYTFVRELERLNPKLGWLLGSPHAPVYPTKQKNPVAEKPVADESEDE